MMVARLCADTAMIAPPLPMVLLLVCFVTLYVFSLPGTFTLTGKCCRYADILSQFVTVDAKCCCCAKVFSLLAPNVSIARICRLFDIVRFSSLNDSVPHATVVMIVGSARL